jgi:2-dehydro-3-deoxygluconokinase
MGARIVCFGELLIRLSAPGRELLLQSPVLASHIGGAEANCGVSLARFGIKTSVVSIVPDNALADAALGELRRYGVDTSDSLTAPGRMGIYFLTTGAIHRPSEVLYDRAASSFALAKPDLIDWSKSLAGAEWFHISGVTPAVSPNTSEAAVRAVRAARAAGLRVSMDCNYRQKLWEARGDDPIPVLHAMMSEAEVIFADPRDIEMVTGKSVGQGDDLERRRHAAALAFNAFPNLKRIAGTVRKSVSVDHNDLSAIMITREGIWSTQQFAVTPIVDRIGGGDAFAAGVLYGLMTGLSEQDTLDFALGAACVKHSIPGDFNLASVADIRNFLSENRFDVRR